MKLILSDVDNTLVTHERDFSKYMIDTIGKFNQNNIFCLCSGRPTNSLINTAKILNARGAQIKYVSGFNGAQLFDLNNNKSLYSNFISELNTRTIVSVLEQLELSFCIYNKEKIYTNDISNKYCEMESTLTGYEISILDIVFSTPKVLVFVDPSENLNFQAKIKEKLPNFNVTESMPYFIEIMNDNVNKSTPLNYFIENLNVKFKHTYGFGDSMNDYELIKGVNYGCVVENGKIELKNICNEVIESVNDDGVAKFINLNLL